MTPQEKYDKTNTIRICGLKLNIKTDAEVIKVLKSKSNKQGYIKDLIKKDMQNT